MLPPGIFLWKSGYEELVSPFGVDNCKSSADGWNHDLDSYGPWSESVFIEGLGEFVRGDKLSASTIVLVDQCDSTMETARLLAERDVLSEWGAVIAVEQTSGRGQLRRPWVSPPGNLHMSVVLPSIPTSGPWEDRLSDLLPLISGYMVSAVLGELGADLKVKWPNDLLQENRKVGGMLIEEKGGLVVLGLGLNVAECPSDSQMREDHSVSAGILQTNRQGSGPLVLGETLVSRGKNVYVVLLDENTPSRFVTALESRLAWFGLMVEVRDGGGTSYQARIIGLSPKGGLVMQREGREFDLFSGSIFPL